MQPSMPLPKYHQVYLVLKDRLLQGAYAQKLPGEIELAEEFGVSRVTVRKSLATLSAEGLIERSAGRGTRPLERARPGAGGARLLQNLVANTRDTQARVLRHEWVAATEPVAQTLQVAPGSEVLHVERVRGAEDGPVSYILAWVPPCSAKGLTQTQLERKPMLSLMEAAGVQIGEAQQTISARQADAAVARLLEVPVGSALLAVQRVVFDKAHRPVQLLQGLYRPDRYEYQMKLVRSRRGDTAHVWVSRDMTGLAQ